RTVTAAPDGARGSTASATPGNCQRTSWFGSGWPPADNVARRRTVCGSSPLAVAHSSRVATRGGSWPGPGQPVTPPNTGSQQSASGVGEGEMGTVGVGVAPGGTVPGVEATPAGGPGGAPSS